MSLKKEKSKGVKPCGNPKKHGRHNWGDEFRNVWTCLGKP